MSRISNSFAALPALALGIAVFAAGGNAFAQASAPAAPKPAPSPKPAAKPAVAAKPTAPAASKPATRPAAAKRPAKPAPVVVIEAPLPVASAEQISAAEKIFYGVSDCEFKQTLDVSINAKHPAYVDVKFDKKTWTMKPVLSSTGALRLEDVKNTAVMIQIAQKSMLLNTVTGQRLVDECSTPKQREELELLRKAAAAEEKTSPSQPMLRAEAPAVAASASK
ncbi:hypothetical protein BH09PSE5_BH09PSE5_06470 [soil metagenome]